MSISMESPRLCLLLICAILFATTQPRSAKAQKQPNNFSFLTGSCAYINPKASDTSYTMYMGEPSMFYTMSRKDADFMLWLGDNWYMGPEDYGTPEGVRYRAHYTRKVKEMQPLVRRNWQEYATWDDHDYGDDQSHENFRLKKVSREVFMETWKDNPYFGENNEGIYTSFRKEDVLFILLDDRWWRDDDVLFDYKYFKPNKHKRMLGKQQMAWLKRTLLQDSSATFKIIVNGSQILNPWSTQDCMSHYPIEYNELLGFISDNHLSGVLFLTGDRHYSEIIKVDRKDRYPLYDITVSPLTSSIEYVKGREKNNKYRVKNSLIEIHNFARFSVYGNASNRKLAVDFFDKYGKLLNSWQTTSMELKDK